ncbi:hypothetical protein BJ138DRAFT_1130590 [Hygrophoropsis aurantiaca]|uniref:Uncharacterized protein n=1 Tax=Hygrophoropsis aurantiaca TaxID=72124 RepID=A0ACB7ZWC0_9AGAM|nr:hypothetical protein BJ138DRAFT_1130590 [Hygrophoropsis aurantiaca]
MAEFVLIQQLQTQQTMIYCIAAGGALVAYDQVLTFSQEVNLVWNQQRSFMTALYLIARYVGSLYVIGSAAFYMRINWTYSVIVNMYLATSWAGNIFLLTMQAILVIRVYALFNRSKKVLVFLATSYMLQATATFVMTGLTANKQVLDGYVTSIGPAIGSVTQAVNENSSAFPSTIDDDGTILLMVFNSILTFFALWAFVKHALEARTMDGGWSINVLVRTLVADHLLYFVCNLAWLLLALANTYGTEVSMISTGSPNRVFRAQPTDALVAVVGPRMVISIRTTENKTRGEGGTLEGEVSTIRFGIQEPPTQSESVMEEGVF